MENNEQIKSEEKEEQQEVVHVDGVPTCPVGYYWNATAGKCVLDVG